MIHRQALTWGLILMFMMSILSGCGRATPTPIVIVPTEAAPVPQANPPAVLPQPTQVPATKPAAAAEQPTAAATDAEGTTTVEPSATSTLPAPIDRPFLMKIDRISVVVGKGTLLEGRVANGTLQASDSIEILGTGNTVINPSILAVLISNTMRDQVTVGDYAGILVGGVEVTNLSPGMLVAKAGAFESYEEALQQLQ